MLDIIVIGRRYLIADAISFALNHLPDFSAMAVDAGNPHAGRTIVQAAPTVAILGEGDSELIALRSISELRLLVPTCGVVVLSGLPSGGFVRRAVAAGALSVVSDLAPLTQLVNAIRGVAAGCLTIDSSLLKPPAPDRCDVNEREREVLCLIASGASTKEIAKELNLAAGTVRNLTSGLMKRLDGRNRYDAARIAALQGHL